MNSLLTALMQQMLKQAEKEMKTQPEVTCQFLCQDEGGKIEVEKFGMPPREKQGLFTTLIRSYFQSKGYRPLCLYVGSMGGRIQPRDRTYSAKQAQ